MLGRLKKIYPLTILRRNCENGVIFLLTSQGYLFIIPHSVFTLGSVAQEGREMGEWKFVSVKTNPWKAL